jgi:hypothetical protein
VVTRQTIGLQPVATQTFDQITCESQLYAPRISHLTIDVAFLPPFVNASPRSSFPPTKSCRLIGTTCVLALATRAANFGTLEPLNFQIQIVKEPSQIPNSLERNIGRHSRKPESRPLIASTINQLSSTKTNTALTIENASIRSCESRLRCAQMRKKLRRS